MPKLNMFSSFEMNSTRKNKPNKTTKTKKKIKIEYPSESPRPIEQNGRRKRVVCF